MHEATVRVMVSCKVENSPKKCCISTSAVEKFHSIDFSIFGQWFHPFFDRRFDFHLACLMRSGLVLHDYNENVEAVILKLSVELIGCMASQLIETPLHQHSVFIFHLCPVKNPIIGQVSKAKSVDTLSFDRFDVSNEVWLL